MKAGPAITEGLPHFLSSPLSPPGGQFIPSRLYSCGSEKQRIQVEPTRGNQTQLQAFGRPNRTVFIIFSH